MVDRSALEVLRDACASADLPDLIRKQYEAADMLLRIAEREEFDNPAAATRAAAAAARVLSDTVAGVVVEERLMGLQAEVERLKRERQSGTLQTQKIEGGGLIGYDSDGKAVRTPSWAGRRPQFPKEKNEG